MQGSFTGELASHGVFNKFPFLKPLCRLFEKVIMRFAQQTICSSQKAIDLFKHDLGIKADLYLVQDGADAITRFDSDTEKRTAYLNKYSLPKDKLILTYTGGLQAAKGTHELVALIQACHSIATKVHFLIVGYPVEEIKAQLAACDALHYCT